MSRAWINKSKSGNWTVGWYENGKRHSKTKYSKNQALEFKADIEHKLNMGLPSALMVVPWDNLAAEYIQGKIADRRAPATIVEIKIMLNNFARLVGRLKSTQIDQASIDKFKLLRGQENISPNTLNKDLANLKAFVRYFSIDRAYIRPRLVIKPVRATVKPVRALDEEQIQTLLRYLKTKSLTYYIRALLALCAGLDSGTIDNIMIQDIHFENDTIDTFRPKKNKWRMARPIQKAVMQEIANFLAEQEERQFRLLPDLYRRNKWVDLCKEAGIITTFRNLRKTYASLLQKKGVSMAVARELLDHESIVTTIKWYTDVSSEHKAAADSLPVEDWV